MGKTPQELMNAYVDSQKFSSTTEVMSAMKEMFRDVLQQVIEERTGRGAGVRKKSAHIESRCRKQGPKLPQRILKKDGKTQLRAVEVKVPRDRNGGYEPQIIGKYSRNADGMEEKILSLYACGMSQRDISEQIKVSVNPSTDLRRAGIRGKIV